MSQNIPSGVWTVLEGSGQYQPTGVPIEVRQSSGRDLDATIVGPYGTEPFEYYRVNASPDLDDFLLRPVDYVEGEPYPNWEGSKLSGSWYPS